MHPRALVLVAALAGVPAAQAQSLQCTGGSVAAGDSKVMVMYKCGAPAVADSFCAPVYQGKTLLVAPEAVAFSAVPCLQTDEWLYERGPGNFLAKVRLRSGVVQSISFGRDPR